MIARRTGAALLAATILTTALGLAPGTTRAASDWQVDGTTQRLEFTATQAGAEFVGRFLRFRPLIRFDPADLADSRFRVEIETASADTQDGERDDVLAGPDFFAAGRHPLAVFETLRIEPKGPAEYVAAGRLTLRGVTRDVTLRFSFRPPAAPGGQARLAGGTTIRRLDFGIGQGEWRDTKWIGDEVEVRFDLGLVQPGVRRPAASP